VPTLHFNIILTGYDMIAINLADIFHLGIVPGRPILPQNQVAALVAAHTGAPNPDGGLCSGTNYGDNVARGYMTVDVVNTLDAGFPADSGYFEGGGTGDASNSNVLWGDFSYIDPLNNFAQGERLVAIEASNNDSRVTTPGKYTFYQTQVGGSAADNREPLASQWAASFDLRNENASGTSLIYWRDPRALVSPAPCGVTPNPFPLGSGQITAFDESSNPEILDVSDLFPYACGRVDLNTLGLSFDKGWLHMHLQLSEGVISQAFIMTVQFSEGRFSSGFQAMPLMSVAGEEK
jgi:hypothetical protein